MDAERIITLLLWPAIGLIAWWAGANHPESRRRWLLIHLALGPLMLVPITWHFVTAPARATAAPGRAAAAPTPAKRDAPSSASRPVGQVDRQQDVAPGFDPRRPRRGRRRR